MWDSAYEAQAKAEGWKLVTVFQNGSNQPTWDITPRTSVQYVVYRAKTGSAMHQQALKLIMDSHQKAKTKTKAKK